MKRKLLVFGIILLFVGVTTAPAIAQNTEKSQSTSRGTWLYVGGNGPGNYTKIQEAINDSSTGDTIYVYSGTYHERLFIQHTLSLIGEDKNSTIIEGNQTTQVINITAEHVNITGFTIQEGGDGGIYIEASYATINNNILTHNNYGIGFNFPYDSNEERFTSPESLGSRIPRNWPQNGHHTVTNNLLSENICGIAIFPNSSHNIVSSNAFIQNELGIGISGSWNNSIIDNSFIHGGILINNDTYSNTVINNTINGKLLFYLEEQSNLVTPNGIGQLILLRCHNITMNNQDLSNNNFCITLIETSYCHITHNTMTFDLNLGIFLLNSDENTIINNTITSASNDAIYLEGNNNIISGNTITFNDMGLALYRSNYNIISHNNISNNFAGIHGIIANNNNTISENIIHSNEDSGIYIEYGYKNILSKNNITSNFHQGIGIKNCQYTTIQNNTISHHYQGISLEEKSTNNTLLGNTGIDNTYGIDISFFSNNNLISDSNLLLNNSCGIHIERSDSNTISNNMLINNTKGISCFFSQKNLLLKNNISWNKPPSYYETGIILSESSNITIIDNFIANTIYGIEITSKSHHNQLSQNTITKCINEAIFSHESGPYNQISNNSLLENTIGIRIFDTNDTLVTNNAISMNTEAGIMIDFSLHTIIRGNTITCNYDGIYLDSTSLDNLITENIIKENSKTGILLWFTTINNTITDNIIQNNTLGINITADSNSINHNIISNNTLGILIWESRNNSIYSNTFLKNTKHASFLTYFKAGHNLWNKNYWGKSRILPQLIKGRINVWFGFSFDLPWFNIDWHPVQEPYDIPGVGQ